MTEPPPDLDDKLGKLIATMRRLPEPPAKAKVQPAIANGMTSYEDWDSQHDGAVKDETEL